VAGKEKPAANRAGGAALPGNGAGDILRRTLVTDLAKERAFKRTKGRAEALPFILLVRR